MAPSINTGILILLEVMQRRNWSDIRSKLKNNLPGILVNQYKLWPAVQLVNFYFVPLQYRVLVIVFVAFFWNIYLANALQASPESSGEVHESKQHESWSSWKSSRLLGSTSAVIMTSNFSGKAEKEILLMVNFFPTLKMIRDEKVSDVTGND